MGQRTPDTPRNVWDIPIVCAVVLAVCIVLIVLGS